MKSSLRILWFFYCILTVFSMGSSVMGADKENCLMCHKYRFIGRIDEKGKKINYNVDEHIFSESIHRNVACRDCHTYIKKIPHDPVKEEVNCANECHIKPPFATENFSHKKIISIYNQSAHGINPDDSPDVKAAKPYCKFCHLNPLYRKVSEDRISYSETLNRCQNCHNPEGVSKAYRHITHRLRKKTSRSPQEIVELCSKCHSNVEKMKPLNVSKEALDAVETYKKSIHGKAVLLGSLETADCISCHATTALHDIYKKDDKKASIYGEKRISICKQCHISANEKFIKIDVHSSHEKNEKPILYFINISLRIVLYLTVFGLLGLLALETYGRKKDGIKFQIRNGTSWRGISKHKSKCN